MEAILGFRSFPHNVSTYVVESWPTSWRLAAKASFRRVVVAVRHGYVHSDGSKCAKRGPNQQKLNNLKTNLDGAD